MTHFPEHMVFMFSFGVDDNSSHCAKRRLFRREAQIDEACIVAVWQIAALRLAEMAVHIQVSIETLFPSVCRVVTRSVHEGPFKVHFSIQRVAVMRIWIQQVEIGASFLFLFVKRFLCR